MKATATAHPNIALVKYWGKRDEKRVLPHQSSLSVTLAPLSVTTSVAFSGKRGRDSVEINGKAAKGSEYDRVVALLRHLKHRAALGAATVVSHGDFPASAGLASSAAAFAALAVAARAAAGYPRDVRAESVLARLGSGSACRSIEGGFVRWNRGTRADGNDSFGVQRFDEHHWPQLRMLVAMVNAEEKAVKSRDGMRNTVKTSPYYPSWIKTAEAHVRELERFLMRRDLEAVGELAERNAWLMHATALGANPPLNYLKPATLAVIDAARVARGQGVPVWFTLDAGPNPVLLTVAAHEKSVTKRALAAGAKSVFACHPGGDAHLSSTLIG